MERLAHALILRRGGDDMDPCEWVDAISEAQFRIDMQVTRELVEGFLTRK